MLVLRWANDLFIENPGFKRIKSDLIVILVSLLILPQSCVEQFIPETTEKKNLLVIEGLITDQCESYEVKLSRSQPLGLKYKTDPVMGAMVTVSDDRGNFYSFHEKDPGVYVSDSSDFVGVIGQKYSLHVRAPDALGFYSSYESEPEEMKQVPPIDSIFYEKILIKKSELLSDRIENCQIYLNTHDDSGNGKYFRWDYTETWEFHLHWEHPNFACWITRKSVNILIKNTSGLARDYINRYPLNYIPETSDKLEVKYSILANQYSISEDEYNYWGKVKSITQDVGGLYDMVPADVPGNISCVTYPEEQVLGYFSVSAKASKRIFIKDNFAGQVNLYSACIKETINNPGYIPGIGSWVWILERNDFANPPYIILTSDKGCVDCTGRGTISKPDFWVDK